MNKIYLSNLMMIYPSIASEWHPEKNGFLKPSDVKPRSNKRVWWQCELGHEWEAKINNRTVNITSCPYCSGNRPIIGKTDLMTTYPKIAKQWHYSKNGNLTPRDVTAKSNRYIWWKCSQGHEWRTKVYHRTDGSDCPYCSGLKVISSKNDLATLFPTLAAEWHPLKNGELKPSDVTSKSHKKVWWICSKGHEYVASVQMRARGEGCPVCVGRKIIPGENDFETYFPELSKEWHPHKNGNKRPSDYAPHSSAYAWWICSEGHEWKTQINNRANGTGCPFCNQKRLIAEKTSLAVINPQLAEQWHPTKNELQTAENTSAFCNDKVLWLCDKNHEWEATVASRSYGNGCPYCSGRLPIPGVTDLASVNPTLSAQWHPTKNKNKTPSDVTEFCNDKKWWVCECGHEWKTTVQARSNGSNCSRCGGRR
jgi:DNA-directed RNA polymerase subunit RPC12/RpoP